MKLQQKTPQIWKRPTRLFVSCQHLTLYRLLFEGAYKFELVDSIIYIFSEKLFLAQICIGNFD